MSVITHAPIQATTRPRATAVALYDLTGEQRRLIDDTLWHLGIEDGRTANNGGIPVIDLRRAYSATAAAAIGLYLDDRAEITQCHTCRAVTSTNAAVECDDGAWRCFATRGRGTSCLDQYIDQQ